MKKRVSGLCMILAIGITMTGCKKAGPTLLTGEINYDTLLVLDNAVAQSALIEDFDKDYYDIEELKVFMNKSIGDYTKIAGEDTVKLESCEVENKVVTAKFSYKSIEHYAKYNEMESAVLSAEEARTNTSIPEQLTSVDNTDSVDKSVALEDDKYKVLITNSPGYNIIVDGKVKYYSNAILLNDNSVQANQDGVVVVVYK